jgi:hypothetical protein
MFGVSLLTQPKRMLSLLSKHGRLPNEGEKKKGEVVTCFYSHSWAHEELHPNIDVEHPCLIDSSVVSDKVIAYWLPPKPIDLSRRTGVNTTFLYKSTSGLLLRQLVQRHHPDEYRILVASMEMLLFNVIDKFAQWPSIPPKVLMRALVICTVHFALFYSSGKGVFSGTMHNKFGI